MKLTDAERELLAKGLRSDDGCWDGEWCCNASLDAALPAVEQIIAARVTAALNEAADARGWVARESSSHLPEKNGIGCICGFCVWSAEHVAVMSHRDGMHNWIAYRRRTPPTDSAIAGAP